MNSYKDVYVEGFKDGLSFGIEKGMELAESWSNNSDCPPNTSPMLVESVPSEPTE